MHVSSPTVLETCLGTGVAASLTRFQRILVGTDGTVTHLLEVYAGEPVGAVKLRQGYDTAGEASAPLALPDGSAPVLRRQVVLRGRHSGTNLLYAEAVVVVERVGPTLVDDLAQTDQPLGVLLAAARTETFREILVVNREPAGASHRHLGIAAGDEVISRTYRIIAGRRPVILVTEKFPAHFFRDLPA